ncbi:MAG: hypothetical protein KDD11_23520, partial [Acidobacteria bacterium]|nr:hypothetical protein [Acidobacteriota bacterium]
MRTLTSWIAAGLVSLLTLPALAGPHQPDGAQSIEDVARQELEAALGDPSTWSAAAAYTADAAPVGTIPLKAGAFRCLPSCAADDGRFLAVAAGASLRTLSETSLDIEVAVPAGLASFDVGIFDGDSDSANVNWDVGVAPFEYTVFADPARDGTGMIPVAGPFASTTMINNGWFDFTVLTSAVAQAPSGNYFYRLRVENLDPNLVVLNSFKVRTDAVVTIEVQQQPFGFYAALQSQQDAQIIFPNFPASPTPTTYDGTFDFFIDVRDEEQNLVLWGGDLDRGSFDGTSLDTDDPDTPNAPFLPPWATVDAVSEGVAVGLAGTTGNPADDTNPAGLGIFLVRSPACYFTVTTPDGADFVNNNPSGNQEWEKFQLTTLPLDPTQADAQAASLPAGTYRIRASGVDMQNLNFWRFFYPLLCVDETGAPCEPLRSFLVGDQVWLDLDGDGIFDSGEPGIDGVLFELLDADGDVIATTMSDAGGVYGFEVDAGDYSVRVADSNFDPGGALEGLDLTTSAA